MNYKKQIRMSIIIFSLFLFLAACSSAGGNEPAVEESSGGDEMEGMSSDEMESMDHEESTEHSEHEHEGDSSRIMNEGATIEITSPVTGTTFGFGEQVLVEVDVQNFELGVEGSHWHVYIDGSSWGMVLGGNLDQPLVGLEPGEHMIETFLANGDHEELMQGSSVMIVVEEQ